MHRCPSTEEGKRMRAHLADGVRPPHTKMASLQPASSSILTTVGRRPTMLRENGNSVSNHVELSSSLRCQLIMHSLCDCRTAAPHNTHRQCKSQAHEVVKSVHGILAGAEEGLCQPRLVVQVNHVVCVACHHSCVVGGCKMRRRLRGGQLHKDGCRGPSCSSLLAARCARE